MREFMNARDQGKHSLADIHARDLTEFDILSTGSIVTRVTPVPRGILVTIRQQCLSGQAIMDQLLWQPDDVLTIMYKYGG